MGICQFRKDIGKDILGGRKSKPKEIELWKVMLCLRKGDDLDMAGA